MSPSSAWGSGSGFPLLKLRRLGSVTLGKMLAPKPQTDSDREAPYLRAANVQPDGVLDLSDVSEMWFSDQELTGLGLRAGDVVVVEGGQGGFGRAAFLREGLPGTGFQNSINRVRPGHEVDGRFLAYALISARQTGYLHAYCDVVSMPHLTAEKLGRLAVPAPPTEEQVAIADFLDRETAKIDALVEKQQALIDGLGRRRGVAISHAVDAESLAARPGPRLRHAVAEVRQGWSPQCNNWPAEGNDWAVLKAGCVNGGLFRPGENKQLPDSLEPRPEMVVRHEELVVSRANTRELVGSAAVVHDASPRLMLSDKLYALTLREEVSPDFVAFALGTRRYRDLIELEATGASYSMQNISQRVILDLPFCVPSRAEQDAVVVEIHALVAELDQLVSKAERFIELAKERRAALITAAVTGELDVTGEVA